jgi:hypothetical protein
MRPDDVSLGTAREFQRDRTAIWFNRNLEPKEAATLPLGSHGARDAGQDVVVRRKPQTVAFRERLMLVGSPKSRMSVKIAPQAIPGPRDYCE